MPITALYGDPNSRYDRDLYGPGAVPVVPTAPNTIPQPTTPLTPNVQLRVPFGINSSGGIAFVSDVQLADRQNLLTLIGTQPGERSMRPDYGVPTRNLLFENDDALLLHTLQQEIVDAAGLYAPEITVLNVELDSDPGTAGQTNIRVSYSPAATRLDTSTDEISTTVADGGV